MSLAMVLAVFALTTSGLYLLLERRAFATVLGVALIGHAVNLLVLLAGRIRPLPPLVTDATTVDSVLADPLPQALVLTAIVISMAVTLYLVAVLARRVELDGELMVVPAPAAEDDDAEPTADPGAAGR